MDAVQAANSGHPKTKENKLKVSQMPVIVAFGSLGKRLKHTANIKDPTETKVKIIFRQFSLMSNTLF